AQHPITDERDIIVPADRLEAMTASRSRPNEALFQRQPRDADIKEAAPHRAENEHEDETENRRQVSDPSWQVRILRAGRRLVWPETRIGDLAVSVSFSNQTLSFLYTASCRPRNERFL